MRRRRRDLLIGVVAGLALTGGLTSYVLRNGRNDAPELGMARARGKAYPVTLTVKPAWAKITLDGQNVGPPDDHGKLMLNVPADGSALNWLKVAAPGFHSLRRPVSVYGGVSEVTVELIQKPYDVAVRTQPPKAEIWINDEMKGYSPLTLTLMPGEKAKLAVKRAGFETIAKELTPPIERDRIDFDFALQSTSVASRIESEPPSRTIEPMATATVSNASVDKPPQNAHAPAANQPPAESVATAWPAVHQREINHKADSPLPARRPTDTPRIQSKPGVVLVLASSSGAGLDHQALLDEMNNQIHRMRPDQHFAIMVACESGPSVWPSVDEMAMATSDQKIRAYDVVREIRPTSAGDVGASVEAAQKMGASAIWLFAATDLSGDLDRLNVVTAGKVAAIHVVTTTPGPRESHFKDWVARHRGTFAILGRGASVALSPASEQ